MSTEAGITFKTTTNNALLMAQTLYKFTEKTGENGLRCATEPVIIKRDGMYVLSANTLWSKENGNLFLQELHKWLLTFPFKLDIIETFNTATNG